LGNPGAEERTILKASVAEKYVIVWICAHLAHVGLGYCEQGNELLVFVKGGLFLDYLKDYQLLMKESAPCSY
jgi:hypothetical protein